MFFEVMDLIIISFNLLLNQLNTNIDIFLFKQESRYLIT